MMKEREFERNGVVMELGNQFKQGKLVAIPGHILLFLFFYFVSLKKFRKI